MVFVASMMSFQPGGLLLVLGFGVVGLLMGLAAVRLIDALQRLRAAPSEPPPLSLKRRAAVLLLLLLVALTLRFSIPALVSPAA